MLVVLLVSALALAAPPPASGPVPDWVEPVEIDVSVPEPQGSMRPAVQYLLIDSQAQIAQDGALTTYVERAYRIVTTQGLDTFSRVEIGYDPYSAHISLHSLEVWRGGAWEDRLDRSDVVEIQQEEGLWQHLLDGTSTLVIVPEDIRVGDVVHFAWSVEHDDPLMAGNVARSWDMAWATPAERRLLRVVYPADLQLQVALHGELPEPQKRTLGDTRELRWDLVQVPAVTAPNSVPVDHVIWPWVQVSTFSSWASVVQWALDLYDLPQPASGELLAVAAQLAPPDATDEEVFGAALRWVQEEVRYFGVELGTGSHQPRPPELVLRRRYGDCKDKTLLLVALLRARGLKAWPALVNTEHRGAIARWLPSPQAFDHVIVAVELGGRLQFVDPTRRNQGGPTASLFVSDYDKALLVRAGQTDLVEIERDPAATGSLTVQSRYQVRDDTFTVELEVSTCAEGARAESFRAWLADMRPDELEERYARYYRRVGSTVRTIEAVSVQDDREGNHLCLEEHYELDDAWVDDEQGVAFSTFAPELLGRMPRVDDPGRDAPLALPEGLREVEEVIIVAPTSWQLYMESAEVRTPWFDYTLDVSRPPAQDPDTQELVLRHSLLVHADQVPADQLAIYERERDRVGDWPAIELTRDAKLDASGASGALVQYASVFITVVLSTLILAATAAPMLSILALLALVYLVTRKKAPVQDDRTDPTTEA